MNCKFVDDFIALDQILIRTILFDVLLIVLIINCMDHRDIDQDEEKFQREILSDEPNLIKLYLQVPHKFQFFWPSHVRWILIELFASRHGSEFSFVCGLRWTSPFPKNAKLIHINWSAYGLRWFFMRPESRYVIFEKSLFLYSSKEETETAGMELQSATTTTPTKQVVKKMLSPKRRNTSKFLSRKTRWLGLRMPSACYDLGWMRKTG